MQLVKVRYFSEADKTLSNREYTYFTEETLALGDIVTVPVKDTTGTAKVTTINVPEAEIEHFRAAVKTIPAGAILPMETPEEAKAIIQPEPDPELTITTIGTALVKINPELDTIVIGYQGQAQDILKYAESRLVASDADMKSATEDLSIIARLKKGIEEKRQEYIKPLITHEKAVNAAFKTVSEPIERADRLTREKIQDYRTQVAMRIAEAEAINREKEALARREAALSGTGEITVDVTPVIVPQAAPDKVRTELGSMGTAKTWKFEVIDFALLPDEYKVPDLIKIGKVVRAGVAVKGVRAWQEESIRISTR